MTETTFEYMNKFAEQIMTISSLLAGFSIAVIANLLVSNIKNRLANNILAVSILAANLFLVSVFAMTRVFMMTTDGNPKKVLINDLTFPGTIGMFAFLLGTVSLLGLISMAGWTKSKKMGIFTTVIGILSLILFFSML